jgi:hypothetical protein
MHYYCFEETLRVPLVPSNPLPAHRPLGYAVCCDSLATASEFKMYDLDADPLESNKAAPGLSPRRQR